MNVIHIVKMHFIIQGSQVFLCGLEGVRSKLVNRYNQFPNYFLCTELNPNLKGNGVCVYL